MVFNTRSSQLSKSAIQRTLLHNNLLQKVANESLVLLQLYRQGTLALAIATVLWRPQVRLQGAVLVISHLFVSQV